MTKSQYTVTRFAFGRPVQSTLVLQGHNKYGTRHVSFGYDYISKEGIPGVANLFNLELKDAKELVEMLKAGISEAKEAADTSPAAWLAKQKPTMTMSAPQSTLNEIADLKAQLAALQQAQTIVTPKAISQAVKRGAANVKPAEVLKPKDIPTLDDLESISTSDLEAVSNIMAILLGKRGTN